ncbi:hypothetical protein GJAV_G00019760 [Gymnothorax javanicus]|nr:hypothetical protein GJAV_G00019760 [Gymnothorax javanicus]
MKASVKVKNSDVRRVVRGATSRSADLSQHRAASVCSAPSLHTQPATDSRCSFAAYIGKRSAYPHHSLKIPPKKRRRLSQKIGPLSHGTPLTVQLIVGELHLLTCPFCCIFLGPQRL